MEFSLGFFLFLFLSFFCFFLRVCIRHMKRKGGEGTAIPPFSLPRLSISRIYSPLPPIAHHEHRLAFSKRKMCYKYTRIRPAIHATRRESICCPYFSSQKKNEQYQSPPPPPTLHSPLERIAVQETAPHKTARETDPYQLHSSISFLEVKG